MRMKAPRVLDVRNLHVGYGSVRAVRGVSLRVGQGEVVGLIGHNGAGKTTTLKAIMGLLQPTSGEILFQDRSIVGDIPEQIARRGIAIVPENRHIFSRLSVGENLRIGTTLLCRARRREKIREALARFPVLEEYFDRPAGTLSGGEQQQLAIARALVSEPILLLLDEPSLGLSPLMTRRVFEVLQELRTEGMAMLLIDQAVTHTVGLADRSYLMRAGGQIVLEGTAAELADMDLGTGLLGIQAE